MVVPARTHRLCCGIDKFRRIREGKRVLAEVLVPVRAPTSLDAEALRVSVRSGTWKIYLSPSTGTNGSYVPPSVRFFGTYLPGERSGPFRTISHICGPIRRLRLFGLWRRVNFKHVAAAYDTRRLPSTLVGMVWHERTTTPSYARGCSARPADTAPSGDQNSCHFRLIRGLRQIYRAYLHQAGSLGRVIWTTCSPAYFPHVPAFAGDSNHFEFSSFRGGSISSTSLVPNTKVVACLRRSQGRYSMCERRRHRTHRTQRIPCTHTPSVDQNLGHFRLISELKPVTPRVPRPHRLSGARPFDGVCPRTFPTCPCIHGRFRRL